MTPDDTSRRTFLKASLAAAAASTPLTRALAADPEPTVFGTPVGLQLYSLREHMPKDVPGTLAKIRAMGFREVEGGGDYGLGVAGFLGELKKADLRVTSALFGYEDWQKDKAARVARAREFGARYTGLAWIPHKQRFTREDALAAAASFNEWGAAAKAAGLRFVYHIHGYEFEASPEGTLFDTLAGQTDPGNVAFEADIFWVRRGGCDPVSLFERYPGRIATTHLKDIQKGIEVCKPDGNAPDETSVPLGEGMIDWPSVLRAAQKAGVERHYIEDEHPNALEQIPRSLKYLAALRS
jgi:sugar phosphate isomerase/epimerase